MGSMSLLRERGMELESLSEVSDDVTVAEEVLSISTWLYLVHPMHPAIFSRNLMYSLRRMPPERGEGNAGYLSTPAL